MQTLWQDIRYGVRMLFKQPGFTLIAVVTLALGIGANTAIFSLVDAVLLRALPYGDADRLVTVWESNRRNGNDQNVINLGNFFDWKDHNHVFEDMATFFDMTSNLTTGGEPEEVPTQIATGNLFSLLGVNALLGRTFTPEDARPGQPSVVVLSFGLWQRRFGGDPQILGRKLALSNTEAVVIGVMPADFKWHVEQGSMTRKVAELWQPWRIDQSSGSLQRRGRFASAVARLKPGASIAQAQADMTVIGSQLEQQYHDFNANWGVNVVPLRRQFTGEVRLALLVLLGAVGCLLLIACANVANLLLARAESRAREVAIRTALGANRARIVRQLLTESMLLAILGGAAGLLLAWWGTNLLVSLSPPQLLNLSHVRVNGPVLGFTLAVSLLTGIIFGLAPAWESVRINLENSLKEGARSGASNRSRRVRNALVIVEIALALMLLVGGGLLIRSFARLQSVDPGFNARNLLTVRLNLPGRRYDNDRKVVDFFRQATAGVQALPGVEAVGAVSFLPFAAPNAGTRVEIEGRPKLPAGQSLTTGVTVTDKNYFKAMQIPLKRGRLFTEEEATEMRHVVVVNEEFARKNLPNEDPLGKRVTIYMKDDNQPCGIIGIVGDSRQMTLDGEAKTMSYWPHPELAYSLMSLVVRTKSDPLASAAAIRNVIQKIDVEQPVSDLRTMESLIGASVARARFNTLLLTVFAVVAWLLAAIGIYGVVAYAVAQRTREIGIRLALGATAKTVLFQVLRQGLTLAGLGVALGLAGSFAVTRVMKTLLFEVSVTDPVTYVMIPLFLLSVALAASYAPARRATKVDPMVALRYE
jgi:putative ABC transport system permease protein